MKTYFPDVASAIQYEGRDSVEPLAFKYYDADQVVGGKTMAEHLRFAVAYWHTLKGGGADMFGKPAFRRPWGQAPNPMSAAKETMDACFEFCTKVGAGFYCFHDRDIAPEGQDFKETCKNLEKMVAYAGKKQAETGVKLLWGTSCLFAHPRYAHGAATNPDAQVFAHAAAQVKHAIDATQALGGENYVFWGGREGYETLLNTDLKREQDNLARFLHLAVDYAKKIGFKGQFLIEPKPCEPTKHQYDSDAAGVLNFLRAYGLFDAFKLNIEANHATLAGHDFVHDLTVASAAGKLGSIDANRGDLLLGWDTDQFPTDVYQTTLAMLVVLRQGGLGTGGLNFDAKVRRGSVDEMDLFHAHVGAMDAFAHGLLVAQKIVDDGVFQRELDDRYSTYGVGIGAQIVSGEADFQSLDEFTMEGGEPTPRSGRQEYLENLLNSYIFSNL